MMYINNMLFGTSPLIVHAPGLLNSSRKIIHMSFNPYWAPTVKNWGEEAVSYCRKETKDELTIITWNTTGTKGYCEISLEKLGMDYLVLGKNVKNWCNINKITSALEVIDSIKTPYIMALDSYDVIVLRDPYEAVEKFKKMDCEMLFNGEKYFYPDYGKMALGNYSITDQWKKLENEVAQSPWRFLNSGAFIVKTEFYKEFLLACAKRLDMIINRTESLLLPKDPVYKAYPDHKISDNDQLIVHWLHHDFYPRIRIDYKMEIFFNTMDAALSRNIRIENNAFRGYDAFEYRVKISVLRLLIKIYRAVSKIPVLMKLAKNFAGKKTKKN